MRFINCVLIVVSQGVLEDMISSASDYIAPQAFNSITFALVGGSLFVGILVPKSKWLLLLLLLLLYKLSLVDCVHLMYLIYSSQFKYFSFIPDALYNPTRLISTSNIHLIEHIIGKILVSFLLGLPTLVYIVFPYNS